MSETLIKFLPDESSIFGWVSHIIDIILTIGVMVSMDVGAGDKVIIHVQDIGQQGLGGLLLEVELLHLVLHHDGFPGDLLPRSGHPKDPRNPLEKQCSHL